MRVLCDEHVPAAVANALGGEGLETARVGDDVAFGVDDDDLLAHATASGYVLLTNDVDFVGRDGHAGVLYYDDQRVPTRELVRAVRTVTELLDEEDLAGETVFVPDGWV